MEHTSRSVDELIRHCVVYVLSLSLPLRVPAPLLEQSALCMTILYVHFGFWSHLYRYLYNTQRENTWAYTQLLCLHFPHFFCHNLYTHSALCLSLSPSVFCSVCHAMPCHTELYAHIPKHLSDFCHFLVQQIPINALGPVNTLPRPLAKMVRAGQQLFHNLQYRCF